jgi:AcrR family transcriptional regulator
MSKAVTHHEPKQQRSRDTLERLLAATVKVLEEDGLDGATVPAIAKAAKVASASVYRRFVDKDALLRATFLHMLRQSNDTNRDTLAKAVQCETLEATAARLISAMFEQYRHHPRLLRALTRFMENDKDEEFGRNARLHIAENFNLIVDALLPFRAEIHHPFPRRALQFALLWAGSAMEAYALDSASLWHTVLPLPEKELKAELVRGFVAYLRQAK